MVSNYWLCLFVFLPALSSSSKLKTILVLHVKIQFLVEVQSETGFNFRFYGGEGGPLRYISYQILPGSVIQVYFL
jgi:hypothetical protein